MTVRLIYSIISLFLIIGTPTIFYLIQRKRYKIKFSFWSVVVGILVEFICKHVLINMIINTLASINSSIYTLITTTWGYVILDIILTVILLIGGLMLVEKFYYHNETNLTAMVSITLGMTIADILNSTLMAGISNIVYICQSNNGSFMENLLTSLTIEQANAVINSYEALPSSYFLYVGVISFAMLASNYLTMALFCHPNMKTHKIGQLLLIALIVGIYTAIYYFDSPTTIKYANIILLIFSFLQLMFAHGNVQYMIFLENKKKN